MHLGPNFWPLGQHRAGPISLGRLEVKKYLSLGNDQHFVTPICQCNQLKSSKRAKFLALFWPLGPYRAGPMSVGRLEVKKYESVVPDERFGTPCMTIAI